VQKFLKVDPADTTIHNFPHAFINRRGAPILIKTLCPKTQPQLLDMYLAFRPRKSFSGLPPLTDEACTRWVEGMVDTGVSLVALCFDDGAVGHAAVFPMDEEACEMLVVVSPPHQNIGIGTELTRCLIQLANELGFDRIVLNVEARNHAARHVYEKCGFQYNMTGLVDELDMSMDLKRHHRAMNVPIREIMNTDVIVTHPEMPCKVALMMFLADGVAALPVTDRENRLTGIISKTDLLTEANIHKRIGDVQTKEVVTVRTGCTLSRVISLLHSRKLRCIPVVDEHRTLVGIVARKDILSYYLERCGCQDDGPRGGQSQG